MKKILIIGGNGFLGRQVSRMLLEEPGVDEPYIFDLQAGQKNSSPGVRFIAGNRDNFEQLLELRKNHFDCIIDLIAYRPTETEMAIKAFTGYTHCFIHLSTMSVYRPDIVSPFDEMQPVTDDRTKSYMNQKAECERAIINAGEKYSFPYIILRSAPVMGSHDRVSRENYFIKRLLNRERILLPDTDKSPVLAIYIKDLVKTIVGASREERAIGGTFHVAQRELISIGAHIKEIGRLIDCSPSILCVPSESLVNAGFNLSAFPYYTSGIFYPDIRAASEILAFNPTPYKEALKETVDWFMANDPLNQPSWPGKTSMQSRMAAVNDTIHHLKEQAFIAEYEKIHSSYRRQIAAFKNQYKYNRVEDTVDSVTGLFTGLLKKNPHRIYVHENQFNPLMDSPLIQDFDITETFIGLLPGSLLSTFSFDEKNGDKSRGLTFPAECRVNDFHLTRSFNSFAQLEPFFDPETSETIDRYYLYSSSFSLPSSSRYPFHYSHQYLFHVLNFHRRCETPIVTKGITYPLEIDILEDYNEQEDTRENSEITVLLPRDLNRYYFGQCRFFMTENRCPAHSLQNIIIDETGGIKPCLWGCSLGKLDCRLDQLQERLNEMILKVEQLRGCRSCSIYENCPRCLFVENHRVYCEHLIKNPYRFRYTAVYDFIRRLVHYDRRIQEVNSLSINISTSKHRLLLPHLNCSISRGDRETCRYRSKFGILPVVVAGKYYVYDIKEGIIVTLNPTDFLLLEALEEGIEDPFELAGCRFDYIQQVNTPTVIKEEDIVSSLQRLRTNGFAGEIIDKDMNNA